MINIETSISYNMALNKEIKQKIIADFRNTDNDNGSSSVQIALLSERIVGLTGHLKAHAKDFASRRGLLHLVNQRRKLLLYLKKHDEKAYNKVIKKLNLKG